ncbi:3-dehydroquinate synthase [Desulfitispora alkaliphila]|uniref:3-dehydroquinate synthase n=1 Tax=Desulfitispora alkaliphila TaxID=622674 RepID=UPI003D225F89
MLEVNIEGGSYKINIGNGILPMIEEVLNCNLRGNKVAVITDSNVMELHGKKFAEALEGSKYQIHYLIMEPGEKSKSMENYEYICEQLLELGLDREDLIISFGGGVIGDLGGFVASTYLRGIPYIQVPTTLLSQVDSSVGGKVAINLQGGKNIIGSFYHPIAVIMDTGLLNTLSNRVFRDGIGEIIKYGCISSSPLFQQLESIRGREQFMDSIEQIVYMCCKIKRDIVQEDENENYLRKVLNFGHTLGHAVERHYNFNEYSHGEVVALGMWAITGNTEKMGITQPGTSDRLKSLLIKYGLPVEMDKPISDKIISLAEKDKKSSGECIYLVVIKEIGNAEIIKVGKEELKSYLS